MNQLVIEARGIEHFFDRKTPVLRDISLSVAPGEAVALVGANGVGKTTLLSILATARPPKSGTLCLFGIDALDYPDKVQPLVGWMPAKYNPMHQRVETILYFYAACYGYHGKDRRSRVNYVVDLLQLQPILAARDDAISTGWQQRLHLAIMIMSRAKVYILDEPAANLDPKARREILDVFRYLRSKGKTLLVSSHILSELSSICERFLFLHEGSIVFDGDPQQMGATFSTARTVQVQCSASEEKVKHLLQAAGLPCQVHTEGGYLHVTPTAEVTELSAALVKLLTQHDIAVHEVRLCDTLEASFVEFLSISQS